MGTTSGSSRRSTSASSPRGSRSSHKRKRGRLAPAPLQVMRRVLLGAALAVGVAVPRRTGVRPARVDAIGLLGAAARLVLALGGIAVAAAMAAARDDAAGAGGHQGHGEQRRDAA